MEITTTCPTGTTKEVKQDAHVTIHLGEGETVKILCETSNNLFVCEDGKIEEYICL